MLAATETLRAQAADGYAAIVRGDRPAAYWRFELAEPDVAGNDSDTAAPAGKTGEVAYGAPGPRPDRFPLFEAANTAVELTGRRGFIRVKDSGPDSPLDFDKGDSITLEAWVNLNSISEGRHRYIVGKGRTNNPGCARDNQNYALRLTGAGGEARLSFLFRGRPAGAPSSEKSRASTGGEFHRWTSVSGFAPGSGWHYVAATYTFGRADSLRGYIDGRRVKGRWDMGGASDAAPVVDDDELWIGSSMGGNPGSTFHGRIDEVAVYRTALSPERIKARFQKIAPQPYVTNVPVPQDAVLVEIHENIPDRNSWDFVLPEPIERYKLPGFVLAEVPQKYNGRGLRIERSNPFVLRATGVVEWPAGRCEVLLRSRSGARLFIDGRLVATNPFHNIRGDAHGRVRDVAKVKEPLIRPPATGDNEALVVFESTGGEHRVVLELFLGGKKKRPEPGEACVAVRPAGSKQPFRLLGPRGFDVVLTNDGWIEFMDEYRSVLAGINANSRRRAGAGEAAYWKARHAVARREVLRQPAPAVPPSPAGLAANNEIDRFINHHLERAGEAPAPLTGDWAFLRRATLDVTGTVPTPEQIEAFFSDREPGRRARYIDRLLASPGWADHWVGYWQDVLAENPNIVKPTLNNTGPFRFWIHESFLDNKPVDRFVTELIRMEGGRYAGGPAGFAMATQNDVPMAAKAHVIGQAFLGVNMKCARCHDAPFNDVQQKDLFSVAAMLKRTPQEVPATSSIPLSEEALQSLIVEVTLKPGTKVEPAWPFEPLSPPELPDGVLRDAGDSRERLAALVTSPRNRRFARVIVNRQWKRYMGRGLVEPIDDWEFARPDHPALLDWLARELVLSGYDLKHVARLILNSRAYQRARRGSPDPAETADRRSPAQRSEVGSPPNSDGIRDPSYAADRRSPANLFASSIRRRMTAEQIVDSLFTAAGKRFKAGLLTMDVDSSRPYSQFINLGRPRRAWQFASLSNERDRPSLSLPFAQDFVTTLETFGWRAARQNPITERESDPTVLQPAILANGVVARRITRLSEDSALTELALEEQPVEKLVERLFIRLLTRPPGEDERRLFADVLRDGYVDRRTQVDPQEIVKHPRRPTGVSWSNHLSPEANRIKIEMERLVQQGDPPTRRLKPEWRARMEDAVWALINTPEFVFVP